MDIQTLEIIGIVIATLIASGGIAFVVKKFSGLSFVNVALSLVTAIKQALNDAGIAANKFTDILNLIIQALSYVQLICTSGTATNIKVEKAMSYIENISDQLDITLTDNEKSIIEDVLAMGFTLMIALGLTTKSSYQIYMKMSKYSNTSKEIKTIALKYIRR